MQSRRAQSYSKLDIAKWCSKLGFPTFGVTNSTLVNTPQLVKTLESEIREYMHDHYKTRVWELRPHRIDDVLYTSIRGYKWFQFFAYKQSKYDRLVLIKREANTTRLYEDVIRSVGAPNKTVTDNVQVLTGEIWININRRYYIGANLTVSHHQHQNYCEGVGGNLNCQLSKFSTILHMHH